MAYFKLGLLGYPISHSVSPKIHSAALKAAGLDGEYKLYSIAPNDRQGLTDLLAKVRMGEIHGLNVTIPHKQSVMPLLDELTPTAEAIGAVNTISLQNGHLVGDNTDAGGFWSDLQILLSESKAEKKNALILGAGGSARAVAFALFQHGWDVTITTRRIEQAESLVTHYASPQLTAVNYNTATLSSLLSDISLIVNTTPVGMKSHPQGSPWIEELPFPPKAALSALIYHPAVLSFEIWTGVKVPVEKITLIV